MKRKLSFSTALAALLILNNSEAFAVTFKDIAGSETDLLKIIGKVQEYQTGADGFLSLNKTNAASNAQVSKAVAEKEEELRQVRAGFLTEIRKFFGMEEQSSPGMVETLTGAVRSGASSLFSLSASAFSALTSRAPSATASSSTSSDSSSQATAAALMQKMASATSSEGGGNTPTPASIDSGPNSGSATSALAASISSQPVGADQTKTQAVDDIHKIANLRTKKSFQAALSGRFAKIRDELQAAKRAFPNVGFGEIHKIKANIDGFSTVLDKLSNYYAARHDALSKAKEVDTTVGLHGYIFFKLEYKDAICPTLAPDENFLQVYAASTTLLEAIRTTLGEKGTPFYGPVVLDQDIKFEEFRTYAAMLKEYDSVASIPATSSLQQGGSSSSSSSSSSGSNGGSSSSSGASASLSAADLEVDDEDSAASTAVQDLAALRSEFASLKDKSNGLERDLLASREELSVASAKFKTDLQEANERSQRDLRVALDKLKEFNAAKAQVAALEKEKDVDKAELARQKATIDNLMTQIEALNPSKGKGTVQSLLDSLAGRPFQAASSSSSSSSSWAGVATAASGIGSGGAGVKPKKK